MRLRPHRVVGAEGRTVRLADGSSINVASVLWCTGFLPDTSWIDVPGAVGDAGAPVHVDGASPVDGLHWMGLPWQTAEQLHHRDGVDRDARQLASASTTKEAVVS